MEPTKLQMFVAEVQGTAESEHMGLSKQIPLRLRIDLFAEVMALHEILSANQKTPRNKVLNDLLDIAIDQVKKELDQDSYEKLQTLSFHHYKELSSFDSGDLSDDEVSK